jgi:hypothetical protein
LCGAQPIRQHSGLGNLVPIVLNSSIPAFLAAWVRLNAICLIALSRLRPLRGFSASDRRTLRQNSFLASELM